MTMMTKDEMLEFGKTLKEQRKKMKLTQREFAELAGLAYPTIQCIESGQTRAIGKMAKEKIERLYPDITGDHNTIQIGIGSKQSIKAKDAEEVTNLVKFIKIAMQDDFKNKVETIRETLGVSLDESISITISAMKKKGEFDLNAEKVER